MVGNKIRCENGGEWKAREKFSHSALRKYQKKLGNGIATPAQSTISCLEHSSGNKAPEMKCEGPCDRWRELDFFSKSTRRNKVYVCIHRPWFFFLGGGGGGGNLSPCSPAHLDDTRGAKWLCVAN
ncbi:uncharacterized protein PODANS_3_7860 [Podospora anserina S mat+]|uniref:Podospora anserina S mat+ genomic DNA chromosome 3, supercontig 2 n=1 Tax=Podospora anserina (strain S / ATCC MYA-4624 / DSM 980 / FGSC 10383) TaxID=515849 RepID=B2B0Z8_PODAN|nr:uncharacterized protein PODANS_3_7860 [Podospora anserina S mat+]CAP70723.1 unnamed protein product [Podospora anserina S mat+]